MAFTEFCCSSGGSNLNAGTRTGNSTEPGTTAFKVYTSGTWVQATRTFTPAGGANPTTDGIAVNDFVSIYPDAATVSPYVARITTVGATTFVTSATAKTGTAPVDGAVNTSAAIGGAWKGPNAAESFPFGFITSTLTNAAADPPRVNFKNDAAYNITTAITQASAGAGTFQGYTSAYGDLGMATIDGGTSGASYSLLTVSAQDNPIIDFIFANNGATGNATGVVINTQEGLIARCVAHDIRGHGISIGASGGTGVELEAYACNQSNTSSLGGISLGAIGSVAIRCISHDNAGSNNSGFFFGNAGTTIDCIADSNGQCGFNCINGLGAMLVGCNSYNNASDGIRLNSTGSTVYLIESCNLIKNGGYGINGNGTVAAGLVMNCGFGAGTQMNASGATNALTGLIVSGSVTYANDVTPWVDPANGDFRINLAAAKGVGRGNFTQTASSYTGTIGYPDIGAAQHLESVSGGGSPVGLGSQVIKAAL